MEIGLILTIISLFLTVAFSEPGIKLAVRSWKRIRAQHAWSIDLQVDKRKIPIRSDYAFEFWKESVTVDANGNATKSVEARICNISSAPLKGFAPPVYSDPKDVSQTRIQPWATSGMKKLKAGVIDWVPERARGRIQIHFSPALPPAERLRFRYGHYFPGAFNEGEEWYSCDVVSPHYEIEGIIKFDHAWVVSSLHWIGYYQDKNVTLELEENTVRWQVPFPKSGERIEIRFVLTRRV